MNEQQWMLPEDGCAVMCKPADIGEVQGNLEAWNREILTALGRGQWGTRFTTYFVYDGAGSFAPSKFAAYVRVRGGRRLPMTLADYCAPGGAQHTKNGGDAWHHLVDLGYRLVDGSHAPGVLQQFNQWNARINPPIQVRAGGPKFLIYDRNQ